MPLLFDVDYLKAGFDMNHIEKCLLLTSDCGHCQHILDKGLFYYAKHQIFIFVPVYAIILLDLVYDYDNRQIVNFIKKASISPIICVLLNLLVFAKFIYEFMKKSRYLANFRALNKCFKIFILSSRIDKIDDTLLDRKATITAVARFL